MNVHLANDRPKPDNAPYREAIVWQKHMSNKNPIQLKMKATETKTVISKAQKQLNSYN